MIWPQYLMGLSCELAPAELALDVAFGTVMLQMLGQVFAGQLDGAAVGTGDHIEGAGWEVALGKKQTSMFCSILLQWHSSHF